MPGNRRGESPLESAALREARRSHEIKDELLAALSHDLRSPLGSLLVWVELLRSQERDPATARVVEKIGCGVRDLRDMVLRFLDMAQLLSGTLRAEMDSTDPAAVVDAALAAVKASAEVKGVRLEAVLDPSLPSLRANARCLRHALEGLASSAVQATPPGGSVEIGAARAEDRILFRVRDSGAGLAPDEVASLGEALARGVTPDVGGLRLAVAGCVARLHGGRVHAASEGEGRGSSFVLDLPLTPLVGP
jgi:signal transduction histidine kinase